MFAEIQKNQTSCPHTHKASIILDNSEISEEFLSRHFEKCAPCKEKLNSLKLSKALISRQVPFSPAPREIKELFKTESIDFRQKVEKRITSQKRKRLEEVSRGMKMFLRDFRTSLTSKQFIFTSVAVCSFWIYRVIFN